MFIYLINAIKAFSIQFTPGAPTGALPLDPARGHKASPGSETHTHKKKKILVLIGDVFIS